MASLRGPRWPAPGNPWQASQLGPAALPWRHGRLRHGRLLVRAAAAAAGVVAGSQLLTPQATLCFGHQAHPGGAATLTASTQQPRAISLRHAARESVAASARDNEASAKPDATADWISFGNSVEIEGATATQAFAVYSHLPNHPQWSSLLSEVQEDDDGSSVWTLRVLGLSISWTARISNMVPPELIAWESTSGVPNTGAATFVDLPGRKRACRVAMQMRMKTPRLLKQAFQSRRLTTLAEQAISKDLERFRDVVLGCDTNTGCVINEDVLVVNATHSDALGSCSLELWIDGHAEVKVRGWGTAGSTRRLLSDFGEGMSRFSEDKAELTTLIDMTRGIGCSPTAVPSIVDFLRGHGDRFGRIAVVGPRPLVRCAQMIATLAKRDDVAFFYNRTEASTWSQSKFEVGA